MIAESILVSLVYDVGTGVVGRLRDSRACRQAVERAAESTAAEVDGLDEADLLAVFEAELDGERIPTDGSAARANLARELEARADTDADVSYESVLDSFLDAVEANLIETGQPEIVSRILYEYARETNALAETVASDLERRHDTYHRDLEALAQWSARMAPSPASYQLPGTDVHVDPPGADAVDAAVERGSNVIVTGPAGVGKSGVLAKRYHERSPQAPAYFLDAREFGQLNSITAIERELGVESSLRELFGELATQYEQCTLLVDQLDNVRTEPVAAVFRHLLRELAEIDGLTVVAVCREWDLEQSVYESLREADAYRVTSLEPLSESQVQSLLSDLGVEEANQSADVVALCRSLLNLSLLADVRDSTSVRFSGTFSNAWVIAS